MKECKFCGSVYQVDLEICPVCGKVIPEEEAEEVKKLTALENWLHTIEAMLKKPKLLIGIIAGFLAAVVGISVLSSYYYEHRAVHGGLSRADMEEIYQKGEEFYNRQDYLSAITELSKISPESKYYDKASDMLQAAIMTYSDDVLSKAKTYADSGDYETACSIIGKAINALSDSSETELGLALSCYSDMMRDQFRASTLDSVNKSVAENDYATAIRVLRSALDKLDQDVEFYSLLEKYEKEYASETLQLSDALLQTDGYDRAVGILTQAMGVMRDDAALQNAIDRLAIYKPTPVSEVCELYGKQVEKASPTTDMFGTTYYGLNYRLMSAGILYGGSHLEVILNKQYDCFEATLAPGTCYKFEGTMKITIYLDDLAVETYEFIYKTHPIDIKIDVTGADAIKIYKNASADDELIIHDPVVYCKP